MPKGKLVSGKKFGLTDQSKIEYVFALITQGGLFSPADQNDVVAIMAVNSDGNEIMQLANYKPIITDDGKVQQGDKIHIKVEKDTIRIYGEEFNLATIK